MPPFTDRDTRWETVAAALSPLLSVASTAAKWTGYGAAVNVVKGVVAVASVTANQLPLLLGDGLFKLLQVLGPLAGVSLWNTDVILSAVHYLRTYQRGRRGDHPLLEHELHNGCPPVAKDTMDLVQWLGPFALHHVYQAHQLDVQRFGLLHGFQLVTSWPEAGSAKPAWSLFASPSLKQCILAIRGSKEASDWDTNFQFDGISMALADGRTVTASKGICEAAKWVVRQASPLLEMLAAGGAHGVYICGHSLGAGVAALVSLYLREGPPSRQSKCFDKVQCVAFAPPPCMDQDAAALCKSYVTSVVLRDDPVPRCSVGNAKVLFHVLNLAKASPLVKGLLKQLGQQTLDATMPQVHLLSSLTSPKSCQSGFLFRLKCLYPPSRRIKLSIVSTTTTICLRPRKMLWHWDTATQILSLRICIQIWCVCLKCTLVQLQGQTLLQALCIMVLLCMMGRAL